MNASEEEMLRMLEGLIAEFYGSATNERKQAIEQTLNRFSQQDDSWNHCLRFLASSKDQYTMMFCLTVLEQVINRRWVGLGAIKGQIRQSLWSYLIENSGRIPVFIRNKTAKLVVDIGRLDWPHFYPDFFTDIYHLIQSKENVLLGLILLQTAIEELTLPRDDLVASRREELYKLLLNQLPHILLVLTNTMEGMLDSHVLSAATATPPPSPTHSSFSNGSFANGNDILSNAFEMSLQRGLLNSAPNVDDEAFKISTQCLNCVAQLFAWMPVHQYSQINNSLLAAVFVFATFGSSSKKENSHSLDTSHLGVLAMNCINEIMAKNCATSDASNFLYQLFQNTFHLLQSLIKENNTDIALFSSLDDDYISKFTEFLRLFIGSHFVRFESQQSFPVVELISLLFQYTFKHSSCERFLSCLEIWDLFLAFVLSRKNQRDEKLACETISKYKSALCSLGPEIIVKVQFKLNSEQLETLSSDSLDTDSQTEWSFFLKANIETLAKISEIIPEETFEVVNNLLSENFNTYIGLQYLIVCDGNGRPRRLQLPEASEWKKVRSSLRDFSTSLQMVGRLSCNFTHENFATHYPVAKSLLEKIAYGLMFSNRNKLYHLEVPSDIAEELAEVHSQLIATVKAYAWWFTQLNSDKCGGDGDMDFTQLVTSIVDHCVEVICSEDEMRFPDPVVHSAVLCLLSVCSTVRPRTLLSLSSVQVLYNKISGSVKGIPDHSVNFELMGVRSQSQGNCLSLPFSVEDELMLVELLSKAFLLPWHGVGDADQEWNSRALHHNAFITTLVSPISRVCNDRSLCSEVGLKLLLKRTLPVLSHIVHSHRDSPTKSKLLLFQSLQDSLGISSSLLPNYLREQDVGEELLSYLLAVFGVLRSQVKLQFIEDTVGVILGVFSQMNLAGNALTENFPGNQLLEKLFLMLTLIVQQPVNSFKTLIPSMMSLVLHQISPLLSQALIPDVLKTFYEFIYQFLFNNFKYFFKSNLLSSLNVPAHEQVEVVEHEEEFLRLMHIYGESFYRTDINLFKQNLEAIENLNFRLKLYHKLTFRKNLLKQFLTLFVQTFLAKSHSILNDEITNVVYNLASVDFETFYHEFIPNFLGSCEGLDDNQRNVLGGNFTRNAAKDLPSFALNFQRLGNDLRYYQLCNNSLPSNARSNIC